MLKRFARRRLLRRPSRGQSIILGVVTLLVLALTVFVTLNVGVAVQQKIRVQNYADAKAFSQAVTEARALNYIVYNNRAIASAYASMANTHAYMSEAAMLVDLKMSASVIMGEISAIEYGLCFCCCSPFGCAPCCFSHCIHGFEANINSIGLLIDWVSGRMGSRIRQMDSPARNLMNALNAQVLARYGAEMYASGRVAAMLVGSGPGNLKDGNMQRAAGVTSDNATVGAFNAANFARVFSTNTNQKRRIMTETVNATRQDFGWNRFYPGITTILFPQISDIVKASLWMGPKGMWTVQQVPDVGITAGGRSAFADGESPMMMGGTAIITRDAAAATPQGRALASFDWGTLLGTWRHGAGVGPLPTFAALGPGEMSGGQLNRHRADLGILDMFNRPHQGSGHNNPRFNMENFLEFNPETRFPYNQPAVYGAASTDGRYTEHGRRGPWENTSSGTVRVSGVGSQQGVLTLANTRRTNAFSKAMVYYHRIGDWSDYPNLFNPYWRAKLHPLTQTDLVALGLVDSEAAAVTLGASVVPTGGKGVNVH